MKHAYNPPTDVTRHIRPGVHRPRNSHPNGVPKCSSYCLRRIDLSPQEWVARLDARSTDLRGSTLLIDMSRTLQYTYAEGPMAV